jgi:MFS family permease
VWSYIAFVGGVAFVVTFMTTNMLYSIHPGLPFWAGSGVLLLVVLMYATLVKEPENVTLDKGEEAEVSGLGAVLSGLRQYDRADLIALLTVSFVKFLAIFGVAALETFGSSYMVTVLGVAPGRVAMYLAIYFVGYLLATIPAGYLSNRFGRKTILRIALAAFLLIGLTQFTVNSLSIVIVTLILAGAANGTTDVMCLPMATDVAPSKKVMGVTVGTMSAITTLASIVSVPFWGAVIQAMGGNFRIIWIAIIVGPLLSLLLTFRLKGQTAEAKAVTAEEAKW